MIDLDGMVSIPYLKKAVFTGSEKKMCFLIRKQSSEEDGDSLQAAVWPGPLSFSSTEDEKKTFQSFAFNKDGLKETVAWLNQCYEEKFGEGIG